MSELVAWRAVPGTDPVRAMSGEGGLRTGGRWHSRGRLVVYVASQPSLTLLEVLANTTAADLIAREYHLMRVGLPEEEVQDLAAADLPPGWQASQRLQATMSLGDAWLAKREAVAWRVPSALVPEQVRDSEHNFVLNPLHPAYRRVVVHDVLRLPFDPRLR